MPLEFPEPEPQPDPQEPQPEGPQASHDTSFKLLAVYAIMALLAVGEIYLSVKLSALRGELEAQQTRTRAELMSALKEQLGSNMERLQEANNQRLEALKGEIEDAIKRAGTAGGELRKARDQVSRLEKQQHDQAEQLKQQIAQKADQQQLGSLHQDLSSQRTDLDNTKKALDSVRSDLGMTRSELGTLIARNHDEVEQLRRMGDRDYFEFRLERKQPLRVANIGLTLTKTNVKHHRFNLIMVVDDTEVERKNRTINEPIFFYSRGSKKPFELVVNSVESNQIKGYISAPKGAVQVAASSGGAR
jgi:hypothetical protein